MQPNAAASSVIPTAGLEPAMHEAPGLQAGAATRCRIVGMESEEGVPPSYVALQAALDVVVSDVLGTRLPHFKYRERGSNPH